MLAAPIVVIGNQAFVNWRAERETASLGATRAFVAQHFLFSTAYFVLPQAMLYLPLYYLVFPSELADGNVM